MDVAIPPVGVVVGASNTADVQLSDPAVSARHCSIVPAPEGFDVKDLDSSNGTFLDGALLKRAVVPVGATLRLGESLLQLVPAEEQLVLAPSSRTSVGEMLGSS